MKSPSPSALRWALIGLGTIGIALLILSNVVNLTQQEITDKAVAEAGELLFEDNFDRQELGEKWRSVHSGWKLVDGWVHSSKAHNRALWLQQAFKGNIIIEFDARSEPAPKGKQFRGDIKIDAFATRPERVQCGRDLCSTGYVVINGGWFNKTDLIARIDEHKTDPTIVKRRAAESAGSQVSPSVVYRWQIVRRDSTIEWYRDGQLQLTYSDDSPIDGGYFGFNNWESEIYFDNLKVFSLAN